LLFLQPFTTYNQNKMSDSPRKLIVPKNVTDALRTVKYPGSEEDIVTLEMPNEIRIAGQRVTFSLVF